MATKSGRKFDEEKFLLYKETDDEYLFAEIIKDQNLKNYIYKSCQQKLRNCPTTLYSIDDLVNISYLIIWQCIHKYRFICPICGIQAKLQSSYKLHAISKHSEYIDPLNSISRYVKFNLGVYLQNEIRKEYSLERRSNVMTINIYSPDEHEDYSEDTLTNDRKEMEIVSSFVLEDRIILKEFIKDLLSQFDNFTKEIFIYLFEYEMKQCDVAEILYNQGKYSSSQSAAVVVSRIVKNKINPAIRLVSLIH
jgi:hypothetical protein